MIVQVVDTKQIEVLVAVPESRMVKIKVGDNVAVKLWASQATNPEKPMQVKCAKSRQLQALPPVHLMYAWQLPMPMMR